MKIKTKTPRPTSRPFKKFYCDRNETFLLPPIAFKIWMYHYARESADRKSWPTVETVMKACGLSRRQTFYQWRGYLREHGWLEKVGEIPSKSQGGKPIPIFRVTRGTIPVESVSSEKRTKPNGAKSATNRPGLSAKSATMLGTKSATGIGTKTATRSRFSEVDSSEVDSKTLKAEVDGPVKGPGLGLNQAEKLPAGVKRDPVSGRLVMESAR